ncbi:hypothetical protein WJX72_008705 [[Myrmecia] bisecta]|uniref:Kinesin-like protein n=1 Tax=[Myrmecia] bisecta TaxID=41462 RepID=A0AAW1R8G7_9CHLO
MSYSQAFSAASLDEATASMLSHAAAADPVREQDEPLDAESCDENFKVVIRVRPPLARELQGLRPFENTVLVDPSQRVITLSENLQSLTATGNGALDNGLVFATYRFTFDHVYDPDSEQAQVYEHSAKGAVLSTLQGYNAAIIAYGQTGTGKTFTMEGGREGAGRGIIPRSIEDVFMYIETDSAPRSKFLVRASYLQIYNEVISDLLKPERQNLVIREDRKRGVFVEGLSEWVVRTPAEVYGLMERGAAQRATGATKLNEMSSRSHAVFIIIVEKSTVLSDDSHMAQEEEMEQFRGTTPGMGRQVGAGHVPGEMRQSVKVGKLNLVDLAGSERVHITGATGKRLEESKKINQSLSALGNVIAALTDARGVRQHIPYRDSKLTRILEDSLGGNCKTTMMAMISPALEAFAESLSTLKFANRAKNIRNLARVNEDLDQRTLLRKYERELRRLRAELQQRQRELVDKRHLLEVEEQKRRAEADKLAAITALEQRSREFMMEKEEKRRLEARISSMQSQLLIGGHKIEDMPVFRTLLAREHRRIRGEYEERLRELERERQGVEEDKAQVDRYKQLLLKQRDIMIALTGRLNERDEQILTLQEELEAYDGHQKALEDALDQKTAELIALRKAAVEQMAASPIKSIPLQSALGAWGNAALPVARSAEASPSQTFATDVALAGLSLGRNSTPASTSGAQSHAGGVEADGVSWREQYESTAAALASFRREAAGLLQDKEAALRDLSAQTASLRQQRDDSRRALAAASHMQEQQMSNAERQQLNELRDQCTNHAKERAALKTILDAKIRALVNEIGHSLAEMSPDVHRNPKLLRQVSALDKLVAATVAAMSASG